MRAKGFTLLELLIVVAVIGIVILLGLPSYRTWIQNTQIRTLSDSLLNGLQLARVEAVKRNGAVTFTLNGNSWAVTDSTGAAIQSRSGSEGTTNAVVSATPAGTAAITFNGLGRSTVGSVVIFDVTNPTGGACQASGGTMRCLRLEVQIGGQVRMCDPKLASTDPLGC
jgi:type IV fimbrial biogenesis protein FimT